MLRRFLHYTTIKEGSNLVTSCRTLVHQQTIAHLRNHSRSMATLETLTFDNTALHALPVDDNASNAVRETPGVVFASVTPTPVANPKLVSYSPSALGLLDLPETEARREEFVQYFSGNRLLPGTEPAAHCYCGHQFGTFSGQLGDGAAVYLGQVVNKKGGHWEMQLKGSGKTPYSRTADGRKVLRSSVREYLCSEAMFHLGIPTTRAATCVTSDTMVVRDVNYTGEIIEERATVILRIAQTFLRFGSFEIFKPTDAVSGRQGPSVGREDILRQLLDYSIESCYPQIWQSQMEDKTGMYLAFFSEVVKRTAQLVAEWQCIGWCHGVLNTDNMSIVGVTIDYGPYGFIDQYESGFVCNSSDNRGRYAFDCQPDICKWNCHKLAEALEPVLPMLQMDDVLQSYDGQYEEFYHHKMMKKFGLMKSYPEDKEIFSTFMTTMEKTGGDFTNCFRALSRIPMPGSHCDLDFADVTSYMLSQCSSAEELQKATKPRLNPGELQMMMLLAEMDPAILEQFRAGKDLIAKELERMKKWKELEGLTDEEKQMQDEKLWKEWLNKYVERLKKEVDGDMTKISQKAAAETRVKLMNSSNPRYILRNYIAQNAIDAAEKGDFSEVNRVLKLLSTPYDNVTLDTSNDITSTLSGESALVVEAIPGGSKPRTSTGISYDDKPPACSKGFKVSCSS